MDNSKRIEELEAQLRAYDINLGLSMKRVEELEKQLNAVRKLPDRWNGEVGEYLGADDCAEELLEALNGEGK